MTTQTCFAVASQVSPCVTHIECKSGVPSHPNWQLRVQLLLPLSPRRLAMSLSRLEALPPVTKHVAGSAKHSTRTNFVKHVLHCWTLVDLPNETPLIHFMVDATSRSSRSETLFCPRPAPPATPYPPRSSAKLPYRPIPELSAPEHQVMNAMDN